MVASRNVLISYNKTDRSVKLLKCSILKQMCSKDRMKNINVGDNLHIF
jgi:hypothetical protein